jgi:hypothetical protein
MQIKSQKKDGSRCLVFRLRAFSVWINAFLFLKKRFPENGKALDDF